MLLFSKDEHIHTLWSNSFAPYCIHIFNICLPKGAHKNILSSSICNSPVLGVAKTTFGFDESLTGLDKNRVMLIRAICYSERIQSKISTGKVSWGQPSPKETWCKLLETSPSGVTLNHLTIPATRYDNICVVLSIGETH